MRDITHAPDHPWARTSVVDTEAIDHERIIATVPVSNDQVEIRIAQRIDFDLLTEPVTTHPSPARITLGQTFEMTSDQARQIGEALLDAAARLDRIQTATTGRLREAS